MKTRVLAVIALALAAFGVAGTAQAAPAPGHSAGTGLVLSVEGVDPAGPSLKVTWLDCTGRAPHPRSADACEQLAAVRGDISTMRLEGRACPMIYQPVRARIFGTWQGQWVSQTRDFSNSCVMLGWTGSIFDF